MAKATVEEIEAAMDSAGQAAVTINPDGSITINSELAALRAQVEALEAENERLRASDAIRQKYIVLMGDEMDELIGLAYVHGWRSTRADEGKQIRAELEALKPASAESAAETED